MPNTAVVSFDLTAALLTNMRFASYFMAADLLTNMRFVSYFISFDVAGQSWIQVRVASTIGRPARVEREGEVAR